jgi:uncharacterized protein (TIGR02145 family)
MKKTILVLLSLGAIVAVGQDAREEKQTVAVYVTGIAPKGADNAGKMLKEELGKAIGRTQKYAVVTRDDADLKALARELTYAVKSGAVKDPESQRKKIGRQDTVMYMCHVEISASRDGGAYYVEAKFIHVESAREGEAATATSRFENDREVMAVAQRLALELTGVKLEMWLPVQETRPAPQVQTFKDSRDGKVYKSVKVGGQTWMAQNLNYAAKGSKCYDNRAENCAKYGRLYDWNTAKKACPAGWRLATNAEWAALVNYAGGSEPAGVTLKSKTGWDGDGNGTDDYGFSALPGGYGCGGGCFDGPDGDGYVGDFIRSGDTGNWWSATAAEEGGVFYRLMSSDSEDVERYLYDKTYMCSVRCIQN